MVEEVWQIPPPVSSTEAPPDVDGSGEIALVGGTASGGVVVGEVLAGHQDHAVAGLGGQFHVGLPVGGAAHLAGALPQQVGRRAGRPGISWATSG